LHKNDVESSTGRYNDTHHIVTEVFEYADDDSWIVSEKAKKLVKNELRK
jgi:hypothetical protein